MFVKYFGFNLVMCVHAVMVMTPLVSARSQRTLPSMPNTHNLDVCLCVVTLLVLLHYLCCNVGEVGWWSNADIRHLSWFTPDGQCLVLLDSSFLRPSTNMEQTVDLRLFGSRFASSIATVTMSSSIVHCFLWQNKWN